MAKRHAGVPDELVNLLFPSRCVGCHREGDYLCAACRETIPRVRPPFCMLCGRPLPVAEAGNLAAHMEKYRGFALRHLSGNGLASTASAICPGRL